MKKLLICVILLLAVHLNCQAVNPPAPASAPTEYYYETCFDTGNRLQGPPSNLTWYDVDNLDKTFTLPNAKFVDISYGISAEQAAINTFGTETAHIVTRLIIDGTERKEFRDICGYTRYMQVFKFQRVFLTAGTHRVKLQWRSSEKLNACGGDRRLTGCGADWKITYLKFIY